MLADILKQARRTKGITQGRLGELVGVSASAIGMYEQGRREPDAQTLGKLCSVLDIALDKALGCENSNMFATKELDLILDDLSSRLKELDGLMFNGTLLTQDDKQQIINALKIGAQLAYAGMRREQDVDAKQQ